MGQRTEMQIKMQMEIRKYHLFVEVGRGRRQIGEKYLRSFISKLN